MSTIRDFIRWGASEFNRLQLSFGHGFGSALDESRYLSLHALHLPYDWPESYLDCVLTPAEREKVTGILQLRAQSRRPAAYITHESWFFGLQFYVDERVLIPRSPISEIIDNGFEPWIQSSQVQRILDLCTGSGCIAIACQYVFAEAEVHASDISAHALAVADINCRRHGLEDRLKLYQSDLFDDIPSQKYDVIITNPPYVDAESMRLLAQEFTFEPRLGLAGGQQGLALVNKILLQAVHYLSAHGLLILEVGDTQAAMTVQYAFLPIIWIDLELGGSGVCCIQYQDLKRHHESIKNVSQHIQDSGG